MTATTTGHSFTNYISDGNATCTQDGTKTAVCDRCDATDTKTDVGSAHGHDFSQWTVVVNPTPISDGLESRYCYHCGLKETRVIARLENPFTDVPVGSFYYEPVLWAVENGITSAVRVYPKQYDLQLSLLQNNPQKKQLGQLRKKLTELP